MLYELSDEDKAYVDRTSPLDIFYDTAKSAQSIANELRRIAKASRIMGNLEFYKDMNYLADMLSRDINVLKAGFDKEFYDHVKAVEHGNANLLTATLAFGFAATGQQELANEIVDSLRKEKGDEEVS